MLSKGASPVAFVEFSDTRLAAAARFSLQGLALGAFGGIRIEFARNKMTQMGYKTEADGTTATGTYGAPGFITVLA
ncbi:hypothetical protein Pcinc_009964 [Petrolisthes cinctipes]|uniref:Uncharacterized protein n=1 Tax=Petrolisthes cinctipes TaxID=88211 RepID=A0AAE1G3Y9_PETCI|nr:hypothetical protein Pcinc_009964 [Petrolisthes cinctipes]